VRPAALRRYRHEVRRTHGRAGPVRVGRKAGAVVVRALSNALPRDDAAIGQTGPLTARMDQRAPPGSLRLTAAPRRRGEGWGPGPAWGPVPVQGLTAPVEVCERRGGPALRGRCQAARGRPRVVGRPGALAVRGQALTRAGAGQGPGVAVGGAAGVGQARRVDECRGAPETQGGLRRASASVSSRTATPSGPGLALLKRYAQGEDHDAPRTGRAQVTGQGLRLEAARQDPLPARLALLDARPEDRPWLPLAPPPRRQRLLAALQRVRLRDRQPPPVRLVCADLHGIACATQALRDRLSARLPTARRLLLGNDRPASPPGWRRTTSSTP
jgi:hypothetical protein